MIYIHFQFKGCLILMHINIKHQVYLIYKIYALLVKTSTYTLGSWGQLKVKFEKLLENKKQNMFY